jgi:hypothetical protein
MERNGKMFAVPRLRASGCSPNSRGSGRQRAAAGAPDPGTDDGGTDCNIGGLGAPLNTGARAKCASNWGTFDMVGNPELNLVAAQARALTHFVGFRCARSPSRRARERFSDV